MVVLGRRAGCASVHLAQRGASAGARRRCNGGRSARRRRFGGSGDARLLHAWIGRWNLELRELVAPGCSVMIPMGPRYAAGQGGIRC